MTELEKLILAAEMTLVICYWYGLFWMLVLSVRRYWREHLERRARPYPRISTQGVY